MARFSSRGRGMGLRPVQSLKHIVDINSTVVGAAQVVFPLIIADDSPTLAQVERVLNGSTVHSIYVRVEVGANAASSLVPRIYMYVMKNPGNNLTTVNASSTGDADEKKFIIHQEMTMVGEITGTTLPPSRTMFQGVIRLPRGYKRFGFNDRLLMVFNHEATETLMSTRVCVQCIYKEFR